MLYLFIYIYILALVDGWTPLMKAADNGLVDCLEVLLKHGADVNVVDNDGNTALIVAADNGHLDCIEALLKHGADLNVVGNEERGALMWAAYGGCALDRRKRCRTTIGGRDSSVSFRNPSTGLMECSICLLKMGGDAEKSMAAPPCGHMYCYDCLVRVDRLAKGKNRSGNCPTCRQSYSEIEIKKVYAP
jgi:hypothetical protein